MIWYLEMICILFKPLILPDIMMTETSLNNIKCKWVNLYSQFFFFFFLPIISDKSHWTRYSVKLKTPRERELQIGIPKNSHDRFISTFPVIWLSQSHRQNDTLGKIYVPRATDNNEKEGPNISKVNYCVRAAEICYFCYNLFLSTTSPCQFLTFL